MSESIKFTAIYKGQRRTFEIDPVNGNGGTWHLYIDRRYHGQFFVYQGDWVFRPQKDDYFTSDQIEKLADQLRKHNPVY